VLCGIVGCDASLRCRCRLAGCVLLLTVSAHACLARSIDSSEVRAKALRAAVTKTLSAEFVKVEELPPPRLEKKESAALLPYTGDKFGTRGDYIEGTLYLSRLMTPGHTRDRRGGAAPVVETAPAVVHTPEVLSLTGDDDEDAEEDGFPMDSTETTKNLALALCSFSSSESIRSRVIESGGLARLVATWVSGEDAMKDDIAVALCQLACDDTRATLVSEGALPAILSLAPAAARPLETQQLCARTLVVLTSLEVRLCAARRASRLLLLLSLLLRLFWLLLKVLLLVFLLLLLLVLVPSFLRRCGGCGLVVGRSWTDVALPLRRTTARRFCTRASSLPSTS
jgi:hypothetical protein